MLHALEVGDRRAELLALVKVRQSTIERALMSDSISQMSDAISQMREAISHSRATIGRT